MKSGLPPQQRGLSVRLKLILTSLVVIVGLLGGLGIMAHHWQQSQEFAKIDAFLKVETSATASVATTDLPENAAGKSAVSDFINSPKYRGYLKDYLTNRLNRPAIYKTTLSIFNSTNQILASSNAALPINPADLEAMDTLISDPVLLPDGSKIITVTKGKLIFRELILPVIHDLELVATIRLACLLTPALQAIRDFDRSLVGILSVIGLLAGIGSIFLITRTLRPVNQMRLAADHINESNLDARIPETGGRDEISSLSRTFNRLLSRIEQAYRYQSQLVEDLSHQLKTPLTILRGSIDLALRNHFDPANHKRMLEDSLADIDRLSAFLITILGLARLESKTMAVKGEPADLVMLISEMVQDMEPLWVENHLHFSFTIKNGDKDFAVPVFPLDLSNQKPRDQLECRVIVDRGLIMQAFMNILSNAFKFCPIGGEIEILLENPAVDFPDRCRIIFANSGPPIPQDDLANIFNRFYRRKPATRDAEPIPASSDYQADLLNQGFGLGLSIARSIIELHQGSIRAFNRWQGGAAFEILLPGQNHG